MGYDDLISARLSQTRMYPIKERKGLGRHIRKEESEDRFYRGHKVRKKGYRKSPRKIATVFGPLTLPLQTVKCLTCGAQYYTLLNTLQLGFYVCKEINFEHEVDLTP